MVVKELVALLGVQTDKQSQNQAEGGLNKIIGLAKAAAAAFAAIKVVGFLKGIVDETAVLGDRFDKLAKRTGLATGMLQGLEHAAELSGASLRDIEVGIKTLQRAQIEAKDGVATYSDEFDRMGLDIKNADGTLKDTTELLIEMGDGLKGLKTDAERTAVASQLLGRGGAKLIPMFAEGSDAIREMMVEMEQLGGVMDEDLVQASADFIDNQRRIDVAIRGTKNAIAKEIMPAVNDLTSGFIEWWKLNGKIIRQRGAEFFGRFGRAILNNVRFFGRLLRTVYQFVRNLSPLQKRILSVAGAVMAIGVALKAGPLGQIFLVAAAIGLLIDDFETWRKGGKSAIQGIINKFEELTGIPMPDNFKEWKESFDYFTDNAGTALDGLFAGAVASLMSFSDTFAGAVQGDTDAWQKGIDRQKQIWAEWLPVISSGLAELGIEFPSTFEEATASIREIMLGFKDWYNGIIDALAISWTEFRDKLVGGVLIFVSKAKAEFASLKESIITWANDVISTITAPFVKAKELLDKLRGKGGDQQPPALKGAGALVGAGAGAGGTAGARAGVGAVAGATARIIATRRSQSIVNAPQTKVEVNVQGGPGMDVTALGAEVERRVGKAIDNNNRAALRVLVPARPPLGA